MVKTRYTWPRKTRARNSKIEYIRIFFFFFEYGFLSVIGKKKKNCIQNGFKWVFRERININKLDPCFGLFHAINKLEHSRNPLDRRIHIAYNQHSPLFLEQKQFALLYIRPKVSFLIHPWGKLVHIEYTLYMYHKSLLNVTLDLSIFVLNFFIFDLVNFEMSYLNTR